MAAWKLAPALARGNTVRAQAGRDDAAHRAAARARSCEEAELPPGVVNIVTGAGDDRRRARRAPRRRQDRVHRLDRGRQGDPAGDRRARGKQLTLELGGKAANIVFDDAAARSGGRGHRQRHLLQPGPRLLRRLAPARAGVRRRRSLLDKLKDRAARRCASAIRSTRTPTSARSTRRCSSRRSQRARRGRRRAKAPSCYQPRVRAARARLLVPRRRSSRACRSRTASRARRSSARCSRCITFRTPDEAIEKANNTMYGLVGRRLDRQGLEDLLDGASACAPASSGRTRSTSSIPTSPFGGYKESGFGREGGRHGARARTSHLDGGGERR